jgi:hypothetical protein
MDEMKQLENTSMVTSEDILMLSISALSEAFNDLISECMDEYGKPKRPTMKAIMRARGCLPPQYSTSLIKARKHEER